MAPGVSSARNLLPALCCALVISQISQGCWGKPGSCTPGLLPRYLGITGSGCAGVSVQEGFEELVLLALRWE